MHNLRIFIHSEHFFFQYKKTDLNKVEPISLSHSLLVIEMHVKERVIKRGSFLCICTQYCTGFGLQSYAVLVKLLDAFELKFLLIA